MPDKLPFGILGSGNIASQFAAAIPGSARCVLAAVGSRSADSAARFANAHGVEAAHAHGSYDELLADPSFQALYISLPNSMHHEWTIKALAAGKHVLCEKPFATNLAQAREMFDAARRHKRILAEAFMYRSHPLTAAVQGAVAGGAIGALRLIRTSFLFAAAKPDGNIRFDPALHGGSLMDVGCYCLSYARLMAGAEPVELRIFGHVHERGMDDYAAGALAFPGGILANFACGITVQGDNTAYLHGSAGHIEVPIPWKPPVSDAEFTVVTAGGRRTEKVNAGKPLYALEADEFAEAVLDGKPPRVSEAETLGNQRCLDELRGQMGLPY